MGEIVSRVQHSKDSVALMAQLKVTVDPLMTAMFLGPVAAAVNSHKTT